MEKYTYQGNRSGTDTTSALKEIDPETREEKLVEQGEEISLSAADRDRLKPYFILLDSDGNDVGDSLVPPSTESVGLGVVSPSDDDQAEGKSPGNISEKSPEAKPGK